MANIPGFPVSEDFFDGQANIVGDSMKIDLADLLNGLHDELESVSNTVGGNVTTLQNATRTFHEKLITPDSEGDNPPGTVPIGVTMVSLFTINTDDQYSLFHVPSNYVQDAAFHVLWTKEAGVGGDGDQSGNNVRWRVSYTVLPGEGSDLNTAPTVIEIDDSYIDNGTTTRIMYKTASIGAAGFTAGDYLAVKIESVTVEGALSCEAALVSLDLTFLGTINQGE